MRFARSYGEGLAPALLGLFLTVTLCGLGAWQLAPGRSDATAAWPNNYAVQGLVHWDSGWYHHIANVGYWYHPETQSPVAFFPAYPLTIRLLSRAGVEPWLSGILISALCGCLAVLLFRRWAERVKGPATARRATLLLVLYPFSFFIFGVMYADACFLLLSVSAFLLLEEDRPGWAGWVGALATATRPVAPALVLGLLVRRLEWKRQRGLAWRWNDLLPSIALLGMASYCSYLYWQFGDPFAFAHVQGAPGWDQPPGWHTWLKVTWFQILSSHPAPRVAARLLAHAAVAVGMGALVWPTFKRLGWGYSLYLAAVTGMAALGSKDFMGMGRYALAGFPAFLTLADQLEGRPRLTQLWCAVSGLAFCLAAVAFGANEYVS